MTISLILLPILVGAAALFIKFNPASLWVGFVVMVSAKAINYALNQPTMKQLYIPTSKDAKYKSQAWLEMFGSRVSKAGGSFVNGIRGPLTGAYGKAIGLNYFLTLAVLISFGLIAIWIPIVLHVSRIYRKAIKEDRLVC
jgi:AAA family ATP:ADP antiporter